MPIKVWLCKFFLKNYFLDICAPLKINIEKKIILLSLIISIVVKNLQLSKLKM